MVFMPYHPSIIDTRNNGASVFALQISISFKHSQDDGCLNGQNDFILLGLA